MKAILALFFLGLVSSSMAFYAVKKARNMHVDTSFLETNRFTKKRGLNHVMVLLQQSFRDTQQVSDFLESLRQGLVEERAAQVALLESSRATCAEEETFRTQAINEGTDSAQRAESQLNLCYSERQEAENLRELAASAIVIYENEVYSLETQRANEDRLYQQSRQKIVNAQEALQRTVEYVDQVEAASYGLAAPELVQLTNNLFRATVKTGHSHHVLPIYTKLLQMHSTQGFGADAIAQIRELLSNLAEHAAQSLSNLDADAAEMVAIYNEKHARLDSLLARLNRQVVLSNDYIDSMTSCVDQETSVLNLSTDKVNRNRGLLDESRLLCQQTESEFSAAELARTREESIINAIQTAVKRLRSEYEVAHAPDAFAIADLRLL